MKRSLFFLLLLSLPLFSEPLFVARHVHPLTISEDGKKLLALNSEDGRLSIFATGPSPFLIRETQVGLVPVSVRLRTPDEAWVVNELSDSISVVSLSKGAVIATIQTGDEPGDIAFANGKAFVTCSRDNRLEVFDPITREKTAEIQLDGLFPRSLALSPSKEELYVSFLHSSNGTTILPREVAPPQKVPTWANPDLPAPPQTAQIVSVDHPEILYEVSDHDVAVISTADSKVQSYRGGLGTNIFNLATRANGDLLVPNSEARNLILFEPELKGRFARSRLGIVNESARQTNLNSDPDLTFPEMIADTEGEALAQVMITLADDEDVWLAAFGSDRIARFDPESGEISDRIDLRQNDSSTRSGKTVRGPRGLARDPNAERLYVLNKLSHTLTTLDTESGKILAETPLSSTPDLADDLKLGRGFLFDARLSGNGTVSCATCHIDLERDGIAWDLGNPLGKMESVKGAFLSLHEPDLFADRVMHPMKGPMITQTLIGLSEQTKLHWRGDKPSIQSFNSTFPNLLGGTEISTAGMDLVSDYLQQLRHHPNPYLKLDRNLPDEVAGGNPTDGIAVFALFDNHCIACHSQASGSSNNIDIPSTVGSFQPLKDSPLRTTYQRTHFDPTAEGISPTGFGLGSDGSLHDLPIAHPYSLHILDDIDRPLTVREKEKRDLAAFVLAFDTGTAPAVGHALTFSMGETSPEKLARLGILEAQASLGEFAEVAVVAEGLLEGQRRTFFFDPPSGKYLSDDSPLQSSEILEMMIAGDAMTFMGVPISRKMRLSTDRNLNGVSDALEAIPLLKITPELELAWPEERREWFPESSPNLLDWLPLTVPARESGGTFFRLRKTY